MKKTLIFLLASLFLTSGTALAIPFNTRPTTVNNAPANELSLQTILDNVLDPNAVNAASDQANDAYWQESQDGDVDTAVYHKI